ncbi:MAG: tyrosine-type recombinase/integrase, partial [Acidimicrobiia bacterium]
MSIRKLKDGRYVIRYYRNGTKTGPRVQEDLGHVSHAEAQRIHRKRLSAGSERRGDPASRVTFGTLADQYLEVHGPNMAERSRERVADTIRLHLKPAFGTMLVESMRPVDIERHRQKRLADGAAPATVNREWAILKAILNKGEAWRLIDRNPIARGAVKVLPVDNGKLIYFEPEEWAAFIGAFDDQERWSRHVAQIRSFGPIIHKAGCEPRRHGAGRRPDSEATSEYLARLQSTVPVFKALLFTGSRLGEILSMKWDDVDLRNGVIMIRQSKTRKAKAIPISAALRGVLSS